MAAKAMTLEVAREILNKSYRHVLADYYFGDAEVVWTTAKEEGSPVVAGGYKGSRGHSVGIDAQGEYDDGSFKGEEARELMGLGKRGSYVRNDTEGDDRNRPL